MDNLLQQLISSLPTGPGYLTLLLLIAFAESLPGIGLLVPGSTLIVLAGFLASHGHGHLLLIIIISSLGAFAGDKLSFWLGDRYGQDLLKLQLLRKPRLQIKQAEKFFVEHGGKSIFFARFLGPIRGITPFIAGLANMSVSLFNRYTLISAILWGLAYPGIGYLGGKSWQSAQSLTTRFGLLIFLALLMTVVHAWVKKLFVRGK